MLPGACTRVKIAKTRCCPVDWLVSDALCAALASQESAGRRRVTAVRSAAVTSISQHFLKELYDIDT